MNEVALVTKDVATITKSDVRAQAISLIDALDNGEISALTLKKFFKAIKVLEEEVKSKMDSSAVDEFTRYGEKMLSKDAVTFRSMEAGTKYDFSVCNDPTWNALIDEINLLSHHKKDREEFLKHLKSPTTIVNEDTGEIITVYPPVKTSTTTIACDFK